VLWSKFTKENEPYLQIDVNSSLKRLDADGKCDFWDSVTLPSPHL